MTNRELAIKELRIIASASVIDVLSTTDDGRVYFDWESGDKESLCSAVRSVETRYDTAGRPVYTKVVMHDKTAALKVLAQYEDTQR